MPAAQLLALRISSGQGAPAFALDLASRRAGFAWWTTGAPGTDEFLFSLVTESPGPEWTKVTTFEARQLQTQHQAIQRQTRGGGTLTGGAPGAPPPSPRPQPVAGVGVSPAPLPLATPARERRPRRTLRPARQPRRPRQSRRPRAARKPRPPREPRPPRPKRKPRETPPDNSLKLWELECEPGVNIGVQIKRTAWSVKNPAETLGGIAGCRWVLAAGCKTPTARRLEGLLARLFGRRPASNILEDVRTDPERARRQTRRAFAAQLQQRTSAAPVPTQPPPPTPSTALCLWRLEGNPALPASVIRNVYAACEPDLNTYYQVPTGARWVKVGPA